jgi:hypothetical protein
MVYNDSSEVQRYTEIRCLQSIIAGSIRRESTLAQ